MRAPCRSYPLVLLVLLLPASALAAWHDRWPGAPALSHFPSRMFGASPQSGVMIQDARGRLLVGSDSLLIYDGAAWSSHPIPNSHDILALALGPDARVWTGAYNQLGYFSESPEGRMSFKSLLPFLPAEHRRFEFVWCCAMVGSDVYFVCKSKILRWDGLRFKVWDFPGATRLYPVRLGEELWFTHVETGLYRITAGGPQREYLPADLPGRPAYGLFRTPEGIRHLSREGLGLITRPGLQLGSSELLDFLRTRPLSSVQPLPDGNFALGTMGGLGIITPDGRLLRSFNQDDGLTGNAISTLFLDREEQLWIGHRYGGITRFDARGSISLFKQWGQSDHVGLLNLASRNDELLAMTDAGVFRLAQGQGHFSPLGATPPAPIFDLGSDPDGWWLCRYGGIDFFDGQRLHPRLDVPAKQVWRLLPSQQHHGVHYCLIERKIVRLSADSAHTWRQTELGELPEFATQCYLDPLDNLWCNSAQTGVWHFDTTTRQFTNLPPRSPAAFPATHSQVTGQGSSVYFFDQLAGYLVDIATKKPTELAHFPPLATVHAGLAPNGRRLYVVFKRQTPGLASYGLGRLQLAVDGRSENWAELTATSLDSIGLPSTLLVTGEDGSDTVWVGGNEGLIKIKPAELAPVSAPTTPWLQVVTQGWSPGDSASMPSLSFADHQLSIRLGTSEITTRPQLRFQTKLNHGHSEWSQPSPLVDFEFRNLSDGTYRFEARAVNAAGLTSPPVAYAFRILPPWYRTTWAYAAAALALAATTFGSVRFLSRHIRQRNQQLERLVSDRTAALTKANAAKDEFLAGISHEIRNPMNGILGLARTIDDSTLEPTARAQLSQLRGCASHLSVLLEDMLDFSRAQNEGIQLNPQPFALTTLTSSLAALTATEGAPAGELLECAISPAVPPFLIGDITRIRQILLNFLLNAFRYSGRGPVTLTIWVIAREPAAVTVNFAVCDEGPGIGRTEQARLFRRFERGAAAQTRRIAGSGLGLALCQSLASQMGGRVWLESEPGHGAAFQLSLRLPIATEPHPIDNLRPDALAPCAGHALIIDDKEYNRVVLTGFLRTLGYRVTSAASGEEALALAWQDDFSVVFLDVNLSGISGPETARRLCAQQPAGASPRLLIATTAYTGEDVRAACLAAGMTGFLAKPLTLEALRPALALRGIAPPTTSLRAGTNPKARPHLARVRLLAEHRGTTLPDETNRFLTELTQDGAALVDALARRDRPACHQAAHRLTGRMVFVHADSEAAQARRLADMAELGAWPSLEKGTNELLRAFPVLTAQLQELACQ